ncbi:MAG: hypothetical protein A2162_00035 [Deltaproteobacteria bacterium RBG_13_52_11b]|nr:MAG: hypothetical protein A2162_00035 [Deltaproteobacteria bacterium RBG_13_52_11b]
MRIVIDRKEKSWLLNGRLKCLWLAFAIAVKVFLVILSGPALGEAAMPQISLNPDYTFPTKDTPSGVEVNSASLVENTSAWNGHVVAFTGEAIGEAMVRGNMAWIHLNDDAYMWKNIEEGAPLGGYNSGHAVWIPADLAMKIRVFGDFKHEGDVVKIVGRFHAACPKHGGDMDIHASTLEIVRVGHPVRHVFNTSRAILAGFLLAVAFALHRIRIIVRRRHTL